MLAKKILSWKHVMGKWNIARSAMITCRLTLCAIIFGSVRSAELTHCQENGANTAARNMPDRMAIEPLHQIPVPKPGIYYRDLTSTNVTKESEIMSKDANETTAIKPPRQRKPRATKPKAKPAKKPAKAKVKAKTGRASELPSYRGAIVLTFRGGKATARITADGVTVEAGSQAVLEANRKIAKKYPSRLKQREELIAAGKLVDPGGKLVDKTGHGLLEFTSDVTFTSPSTAASVILGTSANGLSAFKTLEGVRLKDL